VATSIDIARDFVEVGARYREGSENPLPKDLKANVGDLVLLEMGGGKVVPMVLLGHFGRMGHALGICLGEVRREQLSSRWRPSRVCPLPVFAEPKPGASWEIVRMEADLKRMFRVPLAYFPEAEWSVGSNGFGCVETHKGP
jgi:hypothetical protein